MIKKQNESTPKPVTLTPAEKTWKSIKNKKIELFALPNQFVQMHCEPIDIEPTKLYLKFKIAALLPVLEETLRGNYSVELIDKYICVSPLTK